MNDSCLTQDRLISEGGFGFVYQVSDKSHAKFALKRIILQSEEMRQLIRNEVNVWVSRTSRIYLRFRAKYQGTQTL